MSVVSKPTHGCQLLNSSAMSEPSDWQKTSPFFYMTDAQPTELMTTLAEMSETILSECSQAFLQTMYFHVC